MCWWELTVLVVLSASFRIHPFVKSVQLMSFTLFPRIKLASHVFSDKCTFANFSKPVNESRLTPYESMFEHSFVWCSLNINKPWNECGNDEKLKFKSKTFIQYKRLSNKIKLKIKWSVINGLFYLPDWNNDLFIVLKFGTWGFHMHVSSTLITYVYLNDTTDSLQRHYALVICVVVVHRMQDQFQSVI